MSNNHKPNPMDEQVAANITALALGELSGEEAARLQQRVDDDPRLQQQVADVRRVAQLLREPTVPAGTPRASSPASSPKTHAAVLVALDRFESDGQLAAVLATDSSVSATASDAAFNVASDVASETPPVMAAKHGGSKYGGSKHGGSKHGGSSNNGSRWVIGILVSLAATVLLAVFVYNPFSDSPWMLSQAVPTSEQARTNNELAGNELAGRELRRGSVTGSFIKPYSGNGNRSRLHIRLDRLEWRCVVRPSARTLGGQAAGRIGNHAESGSVAIPTGFGGDDDRVDHGRSEIRRR